MYLVHTFKNNFQNAEEKKKVWETISIFDIYIYIYILKFLQKATCSNV